MSQDNVVAFNKPDQIEDPLTELLRTGARNSIQQAVKVELNELMATYAETTDAEARAIMRQKSEDRSREKRVETGQGECYEAANFQPVPTGFEKVAGSQCCRIEI